MSIQSEAPKGVCKICAAKGITLPLMWRTDESNRVVWFCPAHGTPSEAQSGQVVQGVDSSLNDYKQVLNALGYVETVLLSDPRPALKVEQINSLVAGKFNDPAVINPDVLKAASPAEGRQLGSLMISMDLLRFLSGVEVVGVSLNKSQLEAVYDGISAMETPKNLKDAKVLIKIQDEIDRILGRG